MYCKFCGKPINRVTMRCTGCDQPVSALSGGVGFWDLAEGKQEPAAEADTEPATQAADGILPPPQEAVPTLPRVTRLGAPSPEGAELFRVEAEGEVLEIRWQQKDESGTFADFSEDSCFEESVPWNDENGNTVSILSLLPGGPEIAGEFQCVVKYADGSCWVSPPLTLEEAE